MNDLKKHLSNYEDRLKTVFQESCLELSDLIVTKTPFLSGSLKSSWTPNIKTEKAVNVNIPIGKIASPAKADSLKRKNISRVTKNLKAGDEYHFANGQPYARRIEYEGWSKYKAPYGMMWVSVTQWGAIVRKANKRANRGN